MSEGNNAFVTPYIICCCLFSYLGTRPRDEIVETALYYLKDEEEWGDYNLVFNNCEHFASFCATGVKRSGQVEKTVIAGAVGVGVAAKIAFDVLSSKDKDDESDDDDSDGDVNILALGVKLALTIFSD